MDRHRRPYTVLGAAAVVALIACGDPYLHTNPYDPSHPVDIAIAGPDTIFSLGENAQYTVQANPAWPDTGIVWALDTFTDYFFAAAPNASCTSQFAPGDTILHATTLGAYQSILMPLEPYSFTIGVEAWLGTIDTIHLTNHCNSGFTLDQVRTPRHVGYKQVVVMQRVTRIQLRCPDTHACAALAAGDSAFIWVDGFDALDNQISGLSNPTVNPASGNPTLPYQFTNPAIQAALKTNNPIATCVSRDTTIARTTPIGIRVARVTPLAAGSTWVVATRGALTDSLQIVVH
jgi:hypothetical protein